MLRQASRRNAAAIRAGRVTLINASADQLPAALDGPFDAILAVNSLGFWPAPAERLAELRRRLAPGGRIAIASQPRCPGATADTSRSAAGEVENLLRSAGFTQLSTETLPQPASGLRPRHPGLKVTPRTGELLWHLPRGVRGSDRQLLRARARCGAVSPGGDGRRCSRDTEPAVGDHPAVGCVVPVRQVVTVSVKWTVADRPGCRVTFWHPWSWRGGSPPPPGRRGIVRFSYCPHPPGVGRPAVSACHP